MNMAIIGESPADVKAMCIILEALLASPIDLVEEPRVRADGWAAVVRDLPRLLRHYYYQTNAEALVVIVDADNTPEHQPQHDVSAAEEPNCRLCDIRRI